MKIATEIDLTYDGRQVYSSKDVFPDEFTLKEFEDLVSSSYEYEGKDIISAVILNNVPIIVKSNPKPVLDPIGWAAKNHKLIEEKDPTIWAAEENGIQIDKKDILTWVKENPEKITPNYWRIYPDQILLAIKNNLTIENKPPLEWVVHNFQSNEIGIVFDKVIEDHINTGNHHILYDLGLAIKAAIDNNKMIGSKHPIVWVSEINLDHFRLYFDRYHHTHKMFVVEWAMENGKEIEGKKP